MTQPVGGTDSLAAMQTLWKEAADRSTKINTKRFAAFWAVSVVVFIIGITMIAPRSEVRGPYGLVGVTFLFYGFMAAIVTPIMLFSQAVSLKGFRQTAQTFDWWINLNGENSNQVRGAVEEVLSAAEAGKVLNANQRAIVTNIANSAAKEFQAGQMTSNSHSGFGLRALAIIKDQIPTLPTTK